MSRLLRALAVTGLVAGGFAAASGTAYANQLCSTAPAACEVCVLTPCYPPGPWCDYVECGGVVNCVQEPCPGGGGGWGWVGALLGDTE